jgi:predicted nuclease of predicted toxin-antitoxin system
MKYYLDEDLNPAIAAAGRALGVDVVSAHECGARALLDAEQLSRAATDGRCVVTFNRDDFIAATRQAYDKGRPHCGVLIVPPQSRCSRHGLIADALAAHAARFAGGDLPPYSIDYLKASTPS